MTDFTSLMTKTEKAAFSLRALYASRGYLPYRMSKFEEYDLYAKNKDFLVSPQVITFTDTDGALLALKPDVTLSIAKNLEFSSSAVQKVYYHENVYRPVSDSGFREIGQVGVECFGALCAEEEKEMLNLAAESLLTLSDSVMLSVSVTELGRGLWEEIGAEGEDEALLLSCLSAKSRPLAQELVSKFKLSESVSRSLFALLDIFCPLEEAAKELSPFALNETMRAGVRRLADISGGWKNEKVKVVFDSSVVNASRLYRGVLFQGNVEGVPIPTLSGGRYDPLLARLGKKGGAIGFAVYLDRLPELGGELCG